MISLNFNESKNILELRITNIPNHFKILRNEQQQMNLPLDIIVNEIFPKLELSGIIALTIACPSIKNLSQKYIFKLKEVLEIDYAQNHTHVLNHLEFKENIRSRFSWIKYMTPIVLYLLTRSYDTQFHTIESDIYTKMDVIYTQFESDMTNNLDIVFSKRFIKPSVLSYSIKHSPKKELTHGNIDFRIFHHLFPKFELSLDEIISEFLKKNQIQDTDRPSILSNLKTEINQKLYDIITQK